MALGQDYTVFKREVWTPRFNVAFQKRLKAKNFTTDVSDGYIPGNYKIHIPHIGNSFAAASIATTSGEITATNVSDTRTILTLDQWEGTAYVMSDYEKAVTMSSDKIKDALAQKMSYALADKLDGTLVGEFNALTPSVGSTGTSLVATNIEKAISINESNSVPLGESSFVFSPKTYWKDVAAIQKYYDASQVGRPEEVANGQRGGLYGAPVYVTENIEAAAGAGTYNALLHKNAIVYGATPIRIAEKEGEHLRVKPTANIIYGYKVMNSKHGCQLLSSRA